MPMGIKSSAYLTVDEPTAIYKWSTPLPKSVTGYTTKETVLEATVSSGKAIVEWYRGDELIKDSVKFDMSKDAMGLCKLTIRDGKKEDGGEYICKITGQEDPNRKDAITKTKCSIVDQKFKFTKKLKAKKCVENDNLELTCEVDDAEAVVTWYKGDKEIKEEKRVKFVADGRKRKLVIKGIKITEKGDYHCKTNADATKSDVIVEYANMFKKTLKDTSVVEREKCVLEVELVDPTAEPEWFFGDEKIVESDRIHIKNLGGGKHQLIIDNAEMSDDGAYRIMAKDSSSECHLTVDKGEGKPKIMIDKDPEGPCNKPLFFDCPYEIEGTRQTPVEAKLIKDGKALPATAVEIIVRDNKIEYKLKKPVRAMAGKFQLKLSNGQGDSIKDVNINIQDVPGTPEFVDVKDIFNSSCLLFWKAPKDDGGMPITHYIVERQDLSMKGGWHEVINQPAGQPCEYHCQDLVHKKTYKFQVKAVNKMGPSEPGVFPKAILAKDPWDEPGKPGNAEVTDWDKSHAEIKWTKPENDGGAPITGYIIEYKQKFGKEWCTGTEVAGDMTTASITGLTEGMQYEFRVRAINRAGPGEPSDPTKPVIIKDRFVKPFIVGDKLANIVVKKGQIVKYDIKYKGEPDPEVTWFHDGKEVNNEGDKNSAEGLRVSIEVYDSERNTILV